MATFTIPGQNLTFDIPEEGEAFRVPDTGEVYVRRGQQLQAVNVETLGKRLFKPSGTIQTYDQLPSGERQRLGRQVLSQAGINIESLPSRDASNLSDIKSAFSRLGGITEVTDLSVFKSTPARTGEEIVQTLSPQNPQGIEVKSSVSGELLQTPSIQENLTKIGVGKDEAAVLAAAQTGGAPVQPEVIKAAEVLRTPAPTPTATTAVLTPAQQAEYFRTEGAKPNPLPPAEWLRQQTGAPTGTPTSTAPPSAPTIGPTAYTGPSLVDYLTTIGQPNDFPSRAKLAARYGIQNYFGTAEQNTQLLGLLRARPPAAPAEPPAEKTTEPAGPEIKGTPPEQQTLQTDPRVIIQSFTDQVNEEAKREMETIAKDTTPAVRKSSELLGTLAEVFTDEETSTEKPVSLAETLAEQRVKLGVGELETKVADLDKQIAQLDNEFRATQQTEEGRLVSTTQIRRRQSQNEINYQRVRQNLLAEKNSAVTQLDQKYGVVNSIVQLTGADIDNANQAYQQKFQQVTTLYNLLKGEETTADARVNQVRDDARANITVMTGLLKSGNVEYVNLPASTKLDIKKMEVAAGFPVGFTEFVSKNVQEEVVSPLSPYTDAAGNRIQPIMTKGADGAYSIKNVTLGAAKPEGGASKSDFDRAEEIVATSSPNMTPEQLKVEISKEVPNLPATDVNNIVASKKEAPFLSKEYFKTLLTPQQLKAAAKEAGFGRLGDLALTEIENYLTNLMTVVEQYRKAGYSDKEILKQMQS